MEFLMYQDYIVLGENPSHAQIMFMFLSSILIGSPSLNWELQPQKIQEESFHLPNRQSFYSFGLI